MYEIELMPLYEVVNLDNKKLSAIELSRKIIRLKSAFLKEYRTKGNTPRATEIFNLIKDCEEELERK